MLVGFVGDLVQAWLCNLGDETTRKLFVVNGMHSPISVDGNERMFTVTAEVKRQTIERIMRLSLHASSVAV